MGQLKHVVNVLSCVVDSNGALGTITSGYFNDGGAKHSHLKVWCAGGSSSRPSACFSVRVCVACKNDIITLLGIAMQAGCNALRTLHCLHMRSCQMHQADGWK